MACGLLWLMAYGLHRPTAYYGLLQPTAYGLLWCTATAYYGLLWPTMPYYALWPTMAVGLRPIVAYSIEC